MSIKKCPNLILSTLKEKIKDMPQLVCVKNPDANHPTNMKKAKNAVASCSRSTATVCDLPLDCRGFILMGKHPLYTYKYMDEFDPSTEEFYAMSVGFDPCPKGIDLDALWTYVNHNTYDQISISRGLHVAFGVIVPKGTKIKGNDDKTEPNAYLKSIGVKEIDLKMSNQIIYAAGTQLTDDITKKYLPNHQHDLEIITLDTWKDTILDWCPKLDTSDEEIDLDISDEYEDLPIFEAFTPQTLRQGYIEILEGMFDMESDIISDIPRHVYWKSFWKEVHATGQNIKEVINTLTTTQSSFDYTKYKVQISSVEKLYYRSTTELYGRLFPHLKATDMFVNGNFVKAVVWKTEYTSLLNSDSTFKAWSEVCYIPKTRKNGMKNVGDYIVARDFHEYNVDGYTRYVYDAKRKRFFQLVNNRYSLIEDESFITICRELRLEYTFINDTNKLMKGEIVSAFKTFHSINFLTQNISIIPFKDYALSRNDLLEEKVTFLALHPSYQVTTCIPHCIYDLKEKYDNKAFTKSQIFHELEFLSLHSFLRKIIRIPLKIEIISHFFSDVIDFANPLQWLLMLISNTGATGKGSINNLIYKFVGFKNTCNVSYKTAGLPHMSELMEGKKAFMYSETHKDKKKFDITSIKDESGGDGTSVNPKGKPMYIIKLKGLYVINSNNPPKVDYAETALYRRMILAQMPEEKPYTLKDYKRIMSSIDDQMELTVFLLTLLIPYNEDALDNYIATNDTKSEYEHSFEDPIWDFFDYKVRRNSKTSVLLSTLYNLYIEFLSETKSKNPHKKTGFGRLFSKHCRDKHLDVGKRRSKDKKDTVYDGIEVIA